MRGLRGEDALMPSARPIAGDPGRKPRRDDVLECRIDGVDTRGRRTAVLGEYDLTLDRGVPGALVGARVVKRRGERIEARMTDVREASPDAVSPRCAHFGTCGGCSFQDVRYAAQLELLARLAERELAPLCAAGARFVVEPVVPCAEPYGYRNKMDFTFGCRRWIEAGEPEDVARDFALGLHVPGRFDKVLDVRRCDLQFEGKNALLASARELALELGLAPWDTRTHSGCLRHLVLRRGVRTGELMVFLVVARLSDDVLGYARRLVQRHAEITTLVVGAHARGAAVAAVAPGEELCVVHGQGFIRERLGELVFEISPGSFFQTNTLQAERLVEIVREEASLSRDEVVLDLFCGGGTFALALARDARLVRGIEREEAAVSDARRNARANAIDNVEFAASEVERAELGSEAFPRADLVVVDPPRAGLHPRAAAALLALAPPRLVYVSCNPRSAARDLVPFARDGYTVERVRPIDLFPHTPHVELVLSLRRGGAA